MTDPLRDARIRAQRFWYLDGLTEIVAGIVQLLMSAWLLVSAPGNSTSSWFLPAAVSYILLLVALAICAPRIMATLRERITYPRSGYVDHGESQRKRSIVVALVVALLSTVVGLLARRYAGDAAAWDAARWIQWLPAGIGLVTGALSVYVGVRQGLPRFYLVGAVAIILGVAMSIEYPLRLATVIYLAGIGCALLSSGGFTLWKYLRPGPPPSACET